MPSSLVGRDAEVSFSPTTCLAVYVCLYWKWISIYLLIAIYSHDNSLKDARQDYVDSYSILIVCIKHWKHVERRTDEAATNFHYYNLTPPTFHRKEHTDRPGGISIPEENSTFEGVSPYCYLRSMIKWLHSDTLRGFGNRTSFAPERSF